MLGGTNITVCITMMRQEKGLD